MKRLCRVTVWFSAILTGAGLLILLWRLIYGRGQSSVTQADWPVQLSSLRALSESPFVIFNQPDHGNSSNTSSLHPETDLILTNSGGPRMTNEPQKFETSDQENRGIGYSVTKFSIKNMRTFAMIRACEQGTDGCLEDLTFSMKNCSYNQCALTSNLTEADAVVIYMVRKSNVTYIPKFQRPPGQVWVMMALQLPILTSDYHILDHPLLKGQFNWTLTHRLDSDIPALHGYLQKRPAPTRDYDVIYNRKRVTAAIITNQCSFPASYWKYVRLMQNTAEVHVYGACGRSHCGNVSTIFEENKCLPILSERYFFILAFEDVHCRDYVTNKFFRVFEDVDIVPVVGNGIDYQQFFPRNAFVDVSSFASAKDLAKHLIDLAQDKTKYISMLKEKNRYRKRPPDTWYCQLCKKLSMMSYRKWYPGLRSWLVDGACSTDNRR